VNKTLRLVSSFALAALVAGFGAGALHAASGSRAHTAHTRTASPASGSSWQAELRSLRQNGVYVGFANEAPYAYATSTGALVGENPAVARAILAKLGIHKMDGVLTEFSSLIPGLLAHRFNIITADMAIRPARCKQVAFANPDSSYGEALAVKAGNPLKLHSYADVAHHRKVRIAVMAGADETDLLEALGTSKSQIVLVPDQPSGLAALQDGRVDAFTLTSASLQYLLDTAKPAGIERVRQFTQPVINGKSALSYGAVVFRKEDTAFRLAYNQQLEKMRRAGELARVIRPFGFTAQDVPSPSVTVATLCRG
jgi:polar amino acid transport system substrate-binding protein